MATILQSRRSQNEHIPSFEGAKTSKKDNGFIKSYAVNTHHGIARSYNEDRVSITLNIKKQGIRAHFFAIYDGHGGSLCCEF
ncbi:hypothetical protein M2T37_27710, partial [Klebsiella pneumoniae]|nr:hypothetical protein [Klebsiella pneumoniae]